MSNPEDYKISGINSFRLAIELFNRPYDEGRVEAVLIHLNHAFEMLLKGAILKREGQIRDEDGRGNTYGFEKCVNICRYGQHEVTGVRCISESEGAVLHTINHQRDFAEHEQVQISEGQLYLQSRQGVDIFSKVLADVFNEQLSDYLPERILPLATLMPVDIIDLIDEEISTIERLMEEGRVDSARNRVKSLESLERGLDNEGRTPTQNEMDERLSEIVKEENLERVFPRLFAAISGEEDIGGGRRIQLGSDEGIPATYVPQDEIDEDTDVHLFTVKNLHDKYPLNPYQLRDAVRDELGWDITWARCLAVMKDIGILDDSEYRREDISLGEGDTRDGHSRKAVGRIVEAIEAGVDPDEAWAKHGDEVWG
ncbi:DUF3644 domain-containing protein [Haloferax volcanii]|uniref:DUF3644 domain-containing protein n=1 Tax=Haloferax volcanii TaxID=2246 RepID=UPI0012677441|nr:DUF3644 domain-containing protein [Haloferax lucentense]